jgi:uncharacterized protein
MVQAHMVPARGGGWFRLARGAAIRIVNTHGTQVVDTWAFAAADPAEFMSMEHSRLHMGRIDPQVGDALFSNRRRPILTLIEDSSGGVHDTLLAACDQYRYALLGHVGPHDNCTDTLHRQLRLAGLAVAHTPSPLNLFENARPGIDGGIEIRPPVSPPGSHVTLRAEMDVVVILSACPQDMVPTNGAAMMPRAVEVEILG